MADTRLQLPAQGATGTSLVSRELRPMVTEARMRPLAFMGPAEVTVGSAHGISAHATRDLA
jgi:hypothetical protein